MYLYLYDHFLNDNKYQKVLSRIEMRLNDLGIGGKITRMSPLKNIRDLISDEIRFGVKTIVAVGNDETISSVINNIAKYENLTFGMIPVEKNSFIAQNLGIPSGEDACDVLSARKLEKIDLGKVGNTYFISGVNILAENTISVLCEDKYQIIPETENCSIFVCNLRPAILGEGIASASGSFFNPRDGMLEALVQPIKKLTKNFFGVFKKDVGVQNSIFPFKKISILTKKSVTITTDGKKVFKPPVDIEVVPNKLTVIVGRGQFY